jgi:hypothetical protein
LKEIKLTKGYAALVDDADYEWLSQYNWRAHPDKRKDGTIKNIYADRKVGKKEGLKTQKQAMHRAIVGVTSPDVEVDHKDGNGLNNQRYNLRSTENQNQHNAKLRKDNTSGFKGVHWLLFPNGKDGRWVTRIQVKGKRVVIGCFTDPMKAACAYDMAAVKYFGEFAHCNFALPN